jgi:hypothetical protein
MEAGSRSNNEDIAVEAVWSELRVRVGRLEGGNCCGK